LVAEHGDLRLQVRAAVLDRASVQSGQAEPAPLIEAQRIKVVVRGDDPEPGAIRCCGDALCLRDERASYAASAIIDVEREHLTVRSVQDVRKDIDESVVVVGNQPRMIERPFDVAQARDTTSSTARVSPPRRVGRPAR
jgi:hypothetical protein